MEFSRFIHPFTWNSYSKKLASRIEKPYSQGYFTKEDADLREMRFVTSSLGNTKEGNLIVFYWLVDKDDGIIVDVKFQALGQTALVGAAEVAAEWLVGKNYLQAGRLSADLIDKQVRDKSDEPSFPKETYPHLNRVIEVIELLVEQCKDLPVPDNYLSTPIPLDIADAPQGGYPGFKELPLKKKLQVIEEVLDQDIRPYIAMDGGGVTVLNLIDDKELLISYQGSCTSCYSSVGTTLSYIQQIIRVKVHPDLTVVPNM